MKWYVGSDHAGLKLKQLLVVALKELQDEIVDLGTDSEDSVDYPGYGADVGRSVAADPSSLGLIVCGTGIGISIAANKIRGVRAAVCHDEFTAELSRAHNNANVIAFGARVIGPGVAEAALKRFRVTAFSGGRHQRRIDQITGLER